MNERIEWIDTLKGIAMLAIVMAHIGTAELLPSVGRVISSGANGTQALLIISSMLAFASFDRYTKKENEICSSKRWLADRYIRIAPLYYLLLIPAIIGGGNNYWLGSQYKVSFWNVIAHVMFIHGLFPHYNNSIFGVEWYLGVLAIFYLCIPILYRLVTSIEKSLAMLMVSLIIRIIYGKLGFWICGKIQADDLYVYLGYVDSFSFFSVFPVLMIGIVLFYIIKGGFEDRIQDKKTLGMVGMMFAMMYLIGMVFGKNALGGVNKQTLWAFGFLIMMISLIIYTPDIFRCKLLKLIGKYSYPIYLIHYLIICKYNQLFDKSTENMLGDWILRTIVVLGVTSILSFLLAVLEKYIQSGINMIKRRN